MNQRSPTFRDSFKHAAAGFLYAVRTQRNFRVHLVAMMLVTGMGIWLRLSYQAWAILALTVGTVLVAEMVNTALEALVDLASPEYHPLAKNVKDLAAGSVLLWAIVAVIVGLIILGPPLCARVLGHLDSCSGLWP